MIVFELFNGNLIKFGSQLKLKSTAVYRLPKGDFENNIGEKTKIGYFPISAI